MATKLRRTLFIGLGGTGLQAVLHTKKRLQETYGEVPPMMGFLSIDTDSNSINKTLKTKTGEIVKLDASEFHSMTVQNPKDIYQQQTALFSWMPEENLPAMSTIQFGAGQVRTTGRFAAFCHYLDLQTLISNKITKIANVDNVGAKYSLANEVVEIHMVFSLGGGTGSGTFIDAAYILRDVVNKQFVLNTKVFGYAVLPDVFAQMDPGGPSMARVRPNGFAALKELDYLMHLKANSPPFVIDYGQGNRISTNQTPFDSVMLINNSNQAGHIYTKIEDLAELISLGLTIGGSELGENVQSVMDNVVTMVNGGVLDVENKKAWASGMGICEIYFDGNKLGNIYAEKVINQLIHNINNACSDNNNIANTWIDSPEVMIRENNGQDNVIDRLLDAAPNVAFFDINDAKNAKPELDQYLESVKPNLDSIQDNVIEFVSEVDVQLAKLIKTELNKLCGVGNSIEILKEISNQIKIFKAEMTEEISQFSVKIDNLNPQLQSAVNSLNDANSLFFNKRNAVSNAKEDLVGLVNEMAKSNREKVRREYANRFFNSLQTKVEAYLEKANSLKVTLKSISEKASNQVNFLQNNVNEDHKTFVIELQGHYANQISITDQDIAVNQFVKTLDGNQLFDFMEMNEVLIREKMWNYARNLEGALGWRNKNIEEVIEDLPEEKIEAIIQQAILRSTPLFGYNYRGLVIGKQLHHSFFVGLPQSGNNSRFERDKYFKSFVSGTTNVDFTTTGIKDKIIIYRQIVSVPGYSLAGVEGYENVYKNMSSHHNFHVDKTWEQRMARENFSIHPDRGQDNSIELWVKGIIFGFIKNEGDKYYIKSQSNGDPLENFWHQLSQTSYRDDAFDVFKNSIGVFEGELKQSIQKLRNELGDTKINDKIQNVSSENYVNDYSQVNISIRELKDDTRTYQGVLDLLSKEVRFVETELKK
ncbi:tubulin-like protein [Algoriphagus ratkowskyi]|uniref:Tubulin-like protein n=1 Tax=Algoriphagus ratkowskyi TaxID=57028 RepID=A0A2W7R8X0_9BACT|nr:tubulin-like doman-containing protein [Algoriphagus ratkowskyi]PZX52127.1 tubulin-like protein [Algoriphagus ratkowskyi]TXD76110.1 hypothetical protein ESW18_17735 [Algoriphagus ratkowskyi]